jgi:zinc transporter ZupT
VPKGRLIQIIDPSSSLIKYCSSLSKGMSTCIGALIVFCHPIDNGDDADEETVELTGGAARKKVTGRRNVSPSTMAFSLALAGSVMVTVSVVSIGPECLAASSTQQISENYNLDDEKSFFVFGITLMSVFSWSFLQRLLSFGLGWFSYYLMSRYALPEPEEILSNHFEGVRTVSTPSSDSGKSSDDEHDTDYSSENNSPPKEYMVPLDMDTCNNLNGSWQRRGSSNEDIEVAMSTASGKRKGLIRTHPTERIKCCRRPFGNCISSLLVFMRGSDLETSESRRANRVAMILFFSLLLHNFPEGLAVAASALESDKLGMTVTIGWSNKYSSTDCAIDSYFHHNLL